MASNQIRLTTYISGSAKQYSFDDVDIRMGSLHDDIGNALIGENLSIDTCAFTIRNQSLFYSDWLYDVDDIQIFDVNDDPIVTKEPLYNYPDVDFSRFVPHRDYVDIYHNGTLIGRYYVEDVEKVGTNAGFSFFCVSLMGVLDAMPHRGGIYSGATAGDIIAELMGDLPYSIDADLASSIINGWLPYASSRENLKQVLYRTGGSILRENGLINITYNLPTTVSSKSASQVYAGSVRRKISPATSVSLTEHSYFASSSVEPTVLFDNRGGSAVSSHLIVFDNPYHTLSASGLTFDVSPGANWAVVSGIGVLTGKAYVHVQRVRNMSTGASGEGKEVSVNNATLISPLDSDQAMARLAAYYAQTEEFEADVITTSESSGSVLQMPDPNDISKTVRGYIKNMSRTFSSIIKSRVTLTSGWIPGNVGDEYDTAIIITADDLTNGVWSTPAAWVGKKAKLVLVGAGAGGSGGTAGDCSGIVRGIANYEQPPGINAFVWKPGEPGEGGEGGSGGEGGQSGKVLEATISSLAASYAASFGTGGSGGTGGTVTRNMNPATPAITIVDPSVGSAGSHSVFGTFDSDNGSYLPSNSGLINFLTGESLMTAEGETGANGKAGGRGGESLVFVQNASSSYSYYEQGRGENVDGAWGGLGIIGDSSYVSSLSAYVYYALAGGGGAGGSADNGKTRGSNGRIGSTIRVTNTSGNYHWLSGRRDKSTGPVTGANGGDGADSEVIPDQAPYGQGGAGGSGGGGGGGGGAPHGNTDYVIGGVSSDLGISIGGKGGNGGKGGQGGDGFAVLYVKAN